MTRIPAGSASLLGMGAIVIGLCAGTGIWGCARAQEDRALAAAQDPTLPPAGFGTLRQEDVSLRLQTPSLQVQVVPLDEAVIRLLATDTYTSLHRLAESKRAEIATVAGRYGIREPTVFLVSFFALAPQARYSPDDLTITSQNRLFRPLQILPLSPLWGGQQLNQRETATALYVYEDGIRVFDPFVVEYLAVRNTSWEQILRELERERSSVLARAAAAGKP
jgi:hypothetical protein